MLSDYCHAHDIDILLLQEVTHDQFEEIHNRNIYVNIGTEHRGTAIVTKESITLTDIQRIPSGRGIAARWKDIYI
jgi:exonuclease III